VGPGAGLQSAGVLQNIRSWDLHVSKFLMHRVGSINGLDGKGGPYKRFGCAWWDLHVSKLLMHRVGPIIGFDT